MGPSIEEQEQARERYKQELLERVAAAEGLTVEEVKEKLAHPEP